MRKIIVLFMFVSIFGSQTFGQLTGTYTIPGGTYATIAAAITALNAQGVGAGGVTFNVTAGYTETFASATAGYITTNTGSSTNQIIFQKSGAGADPLITAPVGVGTMDAIICFNGASWITFNGIDLHESAANLTGTTQMEWGFALLKASATQGASNNTIKNCTITLNAANVGNTAGTYYSCGIYSNNHTSASITQLTVTATTGANSNNKIYGNTITNCNGGIYFSGYADGVSPYLYYDQNNDIGSVTGNTITNFGSAASLSASGYPYGVYANYQNGLTIAKNGITSGSGVTTYIYGIYAVTGTMSNINLYNNTVTLSAAGTTGYMYGIYNGIGSSGTLNTVNIYNNTVTGCTYPAPTTAYFYGIYNAANGATTNFYGNTVSNNIIGGSYYNYYMYTSGATTLSVYNNIISGNQRTGAGTQSSSAYFYCLYVTGTAATTIHDNQIFNLSAPAQSTYGAYFYCIYASNSAVSQSVYNNSIHDISITSAYTSSHGIYGMYLYPASTNAATNAVYSNSVYNLSVNLSSTGYSYVYGILSYYNYLIYSNTVHDITQTSTTSYGYNYGIYDYYAQNCYNNTVYNINETPSSTGYGYGYGYYYYGNVSGNIYNNKLYGVSMGGTSGYYYGMYFYGAANVNCYNNYVSDLKAPASISATAVTGIYVSTPPSAGVYYNTVYLNANSTSTTSFGTQALYASTTPVLDMRNNILVNVSTAPGSTTFVTAAYKRSANSLGTYASTSNNNCFYAGTPSATNLIFTDGTNNMQTLAAYKTWVNPADGGSVTELPPFTNIASTPYDLHIKTTVLTQCESGGQVIATPISITTDYDGTPRYPNTGYPNNIASPATAPDIGANEFGGLTNDIVPPSIAFTPLMNTSSLTARTLATTITDKSGVPTSGTGLPRLYWKKFATGTWNTSIATWTTPSTYTFTLGGGNVLGDSIYYYIVAQDSWTTPNVGSSPSNGSGYTANPPACSTPPPNASLYSYKIVSSICGSYNVGAGQTYTTLTAAINDLASKEMTCAVTFRLTDAAYSAETFPIIMPRIPGSSAVNTVTIKPATGVNANISGSYAGPLLIIKNSYTTLDGSNAAGGTTQNLTLNNTSATSPEIMVIGSTGTIPIVNTTVKNCIMINGANTNSAVMISDGTSPGGAAGYFNNITFQNNNIQLAYIALYCIAVPQTGNGSGLLITGNQMNTSGANSIRLVGVYVQGVDGATVSNNTIGNIANTADASNITGIWLATSTVNTTVSGNTITAMSGTAGAPRGIAISSAAAPSNLVITGNTITNLSTTTTYYTEGIYFFAATAGCTISNNMISNIKNSNASGYMACGIYLASTALPANCTVVNNAVWDVAGYGYGSLYYAYNGNGILIYSGSGYNLYFNTVYLNTEQTLATGYPCSLFVYSGMPAASIDLRDNIFSTIQTLGIQRYAICSQSANTCFSNIDYNDYYSAGPSVGYMNGINCVTLADMQTNFGGNVNSSIANPTFVGSDLHITNAALFLKGLYMPAYPTDITGANRTSPTEMGIYQISAYPLVTTNAATGVSFTVATLNGNINPRGLSVTSGFDYGLTTAYGSSVAGTPATVTTTQNISANLTGLAMSTTYHFRAKGLNGGVTVYGSDMTFTTPGPPTIVTVAATTVGSTFATLNGTATANNDVTTVGFDWGLTTAYGNNAAGTPLTVSGNTATNFSANLTGLVINTTYHYRAKGTNGAGTIYGNDMTFFTQCVVPPTPGAISGPPSVCQNTGGYTYSVSQVANGFVYNWTFPAGFTITSYPNSNVVTVSVSGTAVSGTISVYASSQCGANSPSSTMAVTVNPLPVPTVTGASPVCQSTNNNYTTQSNMSAYVWTAGDGTITATGNPAVVTINWPTAGSKTVGVIYTNPTTGCTAASQGTLPVTVNAAPVPTISGMNTLCVNSGYYDYLTQSGKTGYLWTVSSGGTITGGQGTFDVEIQWNSAGAQWVAVNYANAAGCFAPTPTVFNVTVNAIPDAAGAISGPSAVCAGSMGISYSVPPINNASSYVWSLPTGAVIASGSGTNSITVNFSTSAVSGNITVYGNSVCGNGTTSNPFAVTVNQVPDAAGAITGSSSVCEGASLVSYSVTPVNNATGYVWSLPQGATITSGDNTPNILVDFAMGAQSGSVTVYGTNTCGNGTISPSLAVTVLPLPGTPVITNHGDTLYSSAPNGNQWFYNGAPIQNANGQTFVAHYTGWYWDQLTLNSCSSDTSNNIYIVVTGVNDMGSGNFTVYPVPNDGLFKLVMNTAGTKSFDVSICNNLGVTIYTRKNVEVNGSSDFVIDLRPVPAGIYTMVIRNGENKVIRKIVVN